MREGWEMKKLGEGCIVIAGQSPEGKYYNNDGIGLPFYQGKKEFTEKFIGKPTIWTTKVTKEAEDGDILLSVRAPVGPINFSTQKICIGRGLAAIRAGKAVNKQFLYYFLLKNESEIKGSEGAVFASINKNQIESIPIPIPSLSEQQHIVSILDKAFAAIDEAKANTEKNLNNAKELFQSQLNKIFSQKGEGWVEKKLGEVCSLYQGLAINAKTKHCLVEKSELPLLRIKDLKNNTVEQFIDPNNFPSNSLVNKEDLIYTRTGSLGLVFRGFKGVLHNNSFKVVPTSELTSDFLFVWLQSWMFYSRIIALASRAAQPDITHVLFKQQKISFPRDLKEQQKVVFQLNALSAETKKLEALYQQKLVELEHLKKSILEKAFKGELTEKIIAI